MGEATPRTPTGGARPHGGLSTGCLERGKLSPPPNQPHSKEAGTSTVTAVSTLQHCLCPASHLSFFEFKLQGPSSKPPSRGHGPSTPPTTHPTPRLLQTHCQTPTTRPAAHFPSQDTPSQLSCLRLHRAFTQPPAHRTYTSSLPTHHKQPSNTAFLSTATHPTKGKPPS